MAFKQTERTHLELLHILLYPEEEGVLALDQELSVTHQNKSTGIRNHSERLCFEKRVERSTNKQTDTHNQPDVHKPKHICLPVDQIPGLAKFHRGRISLQGSIHTFLAGNMGAFLLFTLYLE